MAHWAVVVSAERYAAERLLANDFLALDAVAPGAVAPGASGVAPGDTALLVAPDDEGRPVLFGLGRVAPASAEEPGSGAVVRYTHRLFDEPVPADGLGLAGPGCHPLDASTYEAWAGKVGAELRVDGPKRTWLVSVDLPIEAASPAEAVRSFWSYVYALGPRELPTFVAPSDDELAMQAFVLGAEANLDPEEDD